MKAILMSVHAKGCALTMNGIKKILIRKGTALYKATQKLIDEYGFAEFYVYCTKDHSLIYTDGTDGKGDYVDYKYYESYKGDKNDIGSGKVIFKFRCYKVEEIWRLQQNNNYTIYHYARVDNQTAMQEDLMKQSCLPYNELHKYLNNNKGTAIHIKKLEIFNKPKELSEFKIKKKHTRPGTKFDRTYETIEPLTKAPQSWCYCEVIE